MKLKDIKESSLSRIHSKMQGSIAGTITAYRSEYSKQDNQKRNKSLVAKLMNLEYSERYAVIVPAIEPCILEWMRLRLDSLMSFSFMCVPLVTGD
jgi:hypothetical protein